MKLIHAENVEVGSIFDASSVPDDALVAIRGGNLLHLKNEREM
jgi:hypothetical protein